MCEAQEATNMFNIVDPLAGVGGSEPAVTTQELVAAAAKSGVEVSSEEFCRALVQVANEPQSGITLSEYRRALADVATQARLANRPRPEQEEERLLLAAPTSTSTFCASGSMSPLSA
eukprot:Hpha_TRINITY_DN4470_c0_g1::TRINITY_DN4470_c0_g1_i2::g.50400::m.50400